MSVKEVPPINPEVKEQTAGERKISKVRIAGLIGGILAGLLVYFLMPANASDVIQKSIQDKEALKEMNVGAVAIVAGVAVWMAIWWMTEAISLAATAMIPLVVFPLLQVNEYKGVAGSYASDTIFLFMGGFILAVAMQRWSLDRRIALSVVRIVGVKPPDPRLYDRYRFHLHVGLQHGNRRDDAPHRLVSNSAV